MEIKTKRKRRSKKIPHYIRQSIELKEKFNDNTNYFIQPYLNPDEERKKKIELFKVRRDKARKFSLKVRGKGNKKLSKRNKTRSSNRKSSINSTDNISSILAKLDDSSSSIEQESQSSSKDIQTNLEPRVQTLEDQLKETQRNPTNRKQIDKELEWIQSQARYSATNESAKTYALKYEKMEMEIDNLKQQLEEKEKLLKNYTQNYSHLRQKQKHDHGLPMRTAREILHRIRGCINVLGIYHNIKCDSIIELKNIDYDVMLELDMSLLKLENMVNEIRNKPMVFHRLCSPKESWKTNKPNRHVLCMQNRSNSGHEELKWNREATKANVNVSLPPRKVKNDFNELKQKLQRLDLELEESNVILNDMLEI